MKKSRVRAKYLVLLVVIGCILAVLALKLLNLTTEKSQKQSRDSALSVVSVLKAKMSREDVYQVFEEYKWSSFADMGNDEVRMWTKPQPLATNWIIRLVFENDELMAIKFGTADNIYQRSEDAPSDILFQKEENTAIIRKEANEP